MKFSIFNFPAHNATHSVAGGQFSHSKFNRQSGQALITLIFFMIIGITIVSAAIAILYTNTLATTMTDQGQVAYYNAESGLEDGLLKILRNPTLLNSGTTTSYTYTSAATGIDVSVTITGTGGSGTVLATGSNTTGTTVRKIQLTANNLNGIISYSNWSEQ